MFDMNFTKIIRQKLFEADAETTKQSKIPVRITDDADTISKLEQFAIIYSTIKTLEKSLVDYKETLKEIAPDIQSLFDTINIKLTKAHNVSLFLRKEGYSQETYSYKDTLVKFFDQLDPEMRAYADSLLQTSKTLAKQSPKVATTLDEPEKSDKGKESSSDTLTGLKRLFRDIFLKIKRIDTNLEKITTQFWDDIKGFDGVSYLKNIQKPLV